MSTSSEAKITHKFKEMVDRGTLSENMKLIYRIAEEYLVSVLKKSL